jgi:glucose-1-phosphate cytidylyltransferase
MKVVILCGGKGIKLENSNEFIPKPMVPIGQIPILCHIMQLYVINGHNQFILCLGENGNSIKEYFLRFREYTYSFTVDMKSGNKLYHKKKINFESLADAQITFLDTGVDTTTGERIAQIEPHIENDEHFFLTYGDTLADINSADLNTFHQGMGRIVTVTAAHPTTPLGVIESDDGLATSFRETDKHQSAVKGGFYVCSRRVFEHINRYKRCVFERDVLPDLAKKHELAVFEFSGFWHLVESYKDSVILEHMWQDGLSPWWLD